MNDYLVIHHHRFGSSTMGFRANQEPTEEQIVERVNAIAPGTIELFREDESLVILPLGDIIDHMITLDN